MNKKYHLHKLQHLLNLDNKYIVKNVILPNEYITGERFERFIRQIWSLIICFFNLTDVNPLEKVKKPEKFHLLKEYHNHADQDHTDRDLKLMCIVYWLAATQK